MLTTFRDLPHGASTIEDDMELRAIATIIWRVIGGVFLIFAIVTAIVQFGSVAGMFGQLEFMDDKSLYTGATLFAIFLWPIVSATAGIAIILAGRSLAGLVVQGPNSDDRQCPFSEDCNSPNKVLVRLLVGKLTVKVRSGRTLFVKSTTDYYTSAHSSIIRHPNSATRGTIVRRS